MSDLAIRLIRENIEKHQRSEDATYLDLGRCGLTRLPPELRECVWLETLILSIKWYDYNFENKEFEEKQSQNKGEPNYIVSIEAVEGLPLLKKLVVAKHYSERGKNWELRDLSPLAALTNLQQLYCSENQISDLSPLAALTNLQLLYCGSNQIADLLPLAALTNLQELDCGYNQIADLSPLAALTNLQKLSCDSNQIADLSPLTALTNLQQLWCDSNQITDLSPLLPLIKNGVPVKWAKYETGIMVENNPLTNPPREVIEQGNEAILRYFEEKERLEKEQVQSALIKVREAKVLLVGQGKSGKTTLRHKLEDPDAKMPAPGDTTRGIEITRLDEQMPHTGEALRLNLWDFGGQDIQHYAHQFFLTGNSLYALVTNERIQDSVHLPYWLNIIEMLGKKSPVIIVQNKDGGNCQPLKEEAAIRARFPNVHNKVFQSDFSAAKTEEEFSRLRKKIVELASELPHIEKPYLRSFNELREKLETEASLGTHYLRWDDYLALMPVLGEDLMRDYAHSLTFLGVCQFFEQDAMLRQYVFLRPKWLIDALFELLLHDHFNETRGTFTENDTFKIWKGREYAGMHTLLVRMMKEFELCYRMDGDAERFIVPQRLPGENKSYGWAEKKDIPVQFRYKFMPKGILTRLICRLHERIEDDSKGVQRVWNDAVIFTLPDGKGRVFVREVYSENTIELRSTGEKHAEMLNEVIRKMDDINRDTKYENLQVDKMVPCPCAECQAASLAELHFFKFSVLEKAVEKNISELRCDKSLDPIRIDDIFGKSGVKRPAKRVAWATPQGDIWSTPDGKPWEFEIDDIPRAFFSYSKKDIEYLTEFKKHLGTSHRNGDILLWDDTKIRPGEEWDDAIKGELAQADIIFLLVSVDFLNTEYIWDTEIKEALRRHEAGEATVIPIKIRECEWSNTPFGKLQGLPRKDGIIGPSPVNDAAWTMVVREIREVLKRRQR